MPESTATERDALTARSIPHMTLSTGDASSMTGPPPPMPHYLTSEGRAVKRFAVEGNAIRRLSVLTVLRLSSPHIHRKLIYLLNSDRGCWHTCSGQCKSTTRAWSYWSRALRSQSYAPGPRNQSPPSGFSRCQDLLLHSRRNR